MLGLVLADDLLLLYVFWELTSVTSFLLIGFHDRDAESRRAALQALLVTDARRPGDARRADRARAGGRHLLARRRCSPTRRAAAPSRPRWCCVLVGAFTKSAQVPFHPWLPARDGGADAGVGLPARRRDGEGRRLPGGLARPGLRRGRPLAAAGRSASGLATMLVGGWRALRQNDLKRLLAFGTVSQLGFLFVLLGAGHPRGGAGRRGAAARARAVQVDAVPVRRDHRPRDRHPRPARARPGWAGGCPCWPSPRRWPRCRWPAVPPLLGFIAKEAAYEAFLHGSTDRPGRVRRAVRRLGADRGVQRPVRLGRLRRQARLRPRPAAHAGAGRLPRPRRRARRRWAGARRCCPSLRRPAGAGVRGRPYARRRPSTSRCGTARRRRSGCPR